jgi:hypothetical protein
MKYPIANILQFREVAVAAFYAQELFQRKKNNASASSRYSVTSQGITSTRRLSSAPAPRSSIVGGTLSTTNQTPSQDFQQAMSWSDVLHLITILREEQKGIASTVSQNEEDMAMVPMTTHPAPTSSLGTARTLVPPHAPAIDDVSTSTFLVNQSSPERPIEEKPSEVKSMTSQPLLTPTKPPPEETKKPELNQEGKKISLGISLKKGGRPVEMTVPSLKSSSLKASSLFSTMKQGLEQLGLDNSTSGLGSDQSKGTPPTKKSSSEIAIKQETILEASRSSFLPCSLLFSGGRLSPQWRRIEVFRDPDHCSSSQHRGRYQSIQ